MWVRDSSAVALAAGGQRTVWATNRTPGLLLLTQRAIPSARGLDSPPSPATFRCTSPEIRRPAATITPLLGCDAFTTGPCAELQELRRCITGAAAGEGSGPALLLLLPAAVLSRRSRSPKEGDDECRPGRRSAAPALLLMGS